VHFESSISLSIVQIFIDEKNYFNYPSFASPSFLTVRRISIFINL